MNTLLACQDSSTEQEEEQTDQTTEIEVNPEDSGPLHFAVTRSDTLNPLFNGNPSLTQMYHLIYESLVTLDENHEVVPLLAKEWEWDESGQSIVFTLRQDVKWHDGEPFVAEDVVFTVNAMKRQLNQLEYPFVHADIINQISDVRKIADHQVRVSFSRPFSSGLEAMVFPVLPQHVFADTGQNLLNSDKFPILGTGPYRVKKYDKTRSFELNAFDGYWGKKPYIKEMFVTVVPDREAAMSMFESGEIDLVEPLSVDWTKHTDRDEVTGKSFLSNRYEFIGFNFDHEWLSQKELRQAIAYAIDREQILQKLYFNHGIISDTPVSPESWLNQMEEIKYEYNVDLAESMIKEMEIPEGTTFTLLTNEDNPLRVATAQIIAESLTAMGLETEMEAVAWEQLQERTKEGSFEMILTGWHLSILPDMSFAFHSTQKADGNFIRYENDRMDEVLQDIFAAIEPNQKKKEWLKFQELFVEEMPYVSLFFKKHAILHRETLRGDLRPDVYNIFRGIESAYIVTPMEQE